MKRWKNASPEQTSCVDVAVEDSAGFFRDSKHPDGPFLTFPAESFGAFMGRVQRGDLDIS